MKVLILGLSSIVRRRVLPALKALPQVSRIDVATAKAADPEVRSGWTHGDIWEDYTQALDHSSAQMAYVSVVNSDHGRWVQAALERGLHVVVDKPAFLAHDQAVNMIELADTKRRCLVEATVFGYHPQITIARRLFSDAGSGPLRISIVLSFPPMGADNFRYSPALGGGALWDVGPYLVATSRIFFEAEPVETICHIVARQHAGVDIAFSSLGTFSGGRSLVGQFGFDTSYNNQLHLIGQTLSAAIDRAFTTPPDNSNEIHVRTETGPSVIKVKPADAFLEFLAHVIDRIGAGDWSELSSHLLADSLALERYRAAAGVTP